MQTCPNAFEDFRPLTRGDILRSKRAHDPVTLMHQGHPVTYEVLRATLGRVRYCRGFGRIEARVAVTYAAHPAALPRTAVLLVSVPLGRKGQNADLRRRLIHTALGLSHRFDQQHKEVLPRAA